MKISVTVTDLGSFATSFPLYHPENCNLFLYKTKISNKMAIAPSHE